MQNQVTIKSGAMHWIGAASVAVNATTDDQFVTLNIKTTSHRIDLMLHIGVALELSGTLEDQVQDNLERIANDLTIIESVENANTETAALESPRHNALRATILGDWENANANGMDWEWLWNDLQYTITGMSQAALFYDVDAALHDELDFLISVALIRKHISAGSV